MKRVIQSFFKTKKETFLILQAFPERTKGLILSVDADRTIVPKKTWEGARLTDFFKTPAIFSSKRKIIISAHPDLAYTAIAPFSFSRDDASRPLHAEELDGFLEKAIHRHLNELRVRAGRELKVPEEEAVLIDSQVSDFFVDGHRIGNPIGFSAHHVESTIELTFTTRAFYEELRVLLARRRDFFFTELSKAELHAASKAHPLPLGLVMIQEDFCRTFLLEARRSQRRISRGMIEWSPRKLFDSIRDAWHVSDTVAKKTYFSYIRGETSEAMRRHLSKMLRPATESFFSGVTRAGLEKKVFLSASEMPFVLPRRRGNTVFDRLPLQEVLAATGFKINRSEWQLSPDEIFSRLAPLWDFYYDRSEEAVNRGLRRRLHWLGALSR